MTNRKRTRGHDPLLAHHQRLLRWIDPEAVAPQVTADDWPLAKAWVTLLALSGDGAVCRSRTADLVEELVNDGGYSAGEVAQGLAASLALGLVSLHYGAADGLDVWQIDWGRVAELAHGPAGDDGVPPETQEGPIER